MSGSPGGRAFATRRVVGVWPPAQLAQRRRLLDAFAQLYPVRFVGRETGMWRGLDGLLAFGSTEAAGLGELPGSVPFLVAAGEESAQPGPARALRLADNAHVARPLRGLRLHDTRAAAMDPADLVGGVLVLAELEGGCAWAVRRYRQAAGHVVGAAPLELAAGESLRERLIPARSLAVLALSHFLTDLTGELGWQVPPPRAAFILDDPNLHWPTYGHLRYREVVDHAAVHRYHLSVAMIPLDAWLAHPGAVRAFRQGREHLSLTIHGNDHDGPELGRGRAAEQELALAAQALSRARSFERRTGITVDRVMVPPHEALSESSAVALSRCGYEAVCTTRPCPWVAAPIENPWAARPPEAGPLPAWGPADAVVDGLPLLLRADFAHPREDLALRAFLGQPLILYGHHDVLRGGLDALAEAAQDIRRLGAEVRFGSLATLARLSVETRRSGAAFEVRMLGRRVEVVVPEGVTELRIDARAVGAEPGSHLRVQDRHETAMIDAGATDVSVPIDYPGSYRLALERPLAPAGIPPPRRRVWPAVRRTAAQARDRARAAGRRAPRNLTPPR